MLIKRLLGGAGDVLDELRARAYVQDDPMIDQSLEGGGYAFHPAPKR